MEMERNGNTRKSIAKIIDAMGEDCAIEILLCRSNRASTIDRLEPFLLSWLGNDLRWEEMEYATMAALDCLGLQLQERVFDNGDGTISFVTPAYRNTRRFYYMTTDDDGNEIQKESYL